MQNDVEIFLDLVKTVTIQRVEERPISECVLNRYVK